MVAKNVDYMPLLYPRAIKSKGLNSTINTIQSNIYFVIQDLKKSREQIKQKNYQFDPQWLKRNHSVKSIKKALAKENIKKIFLEEPSQNIVNCSLLIPCASNRKYKQN